MSIYMYEHMFITHINVVEYRKQFIKICSKLSLVITPLGSMISSTGFSDFISNTFKFFEIILKYTLRF